MAEVEYGQIFNPSCTHNWWWSDCLLKRIRWLAAKRFLCRELEVEPPMEHRHPPLGRAATVRHQGTHTRHECYCQSTYDSSKVIMLTCRSVTCLSLIAAHTFVFDSARGLSIMGTDVVCEQHTTKCYSPTTNASFLAKCVRFWKHTCFRAFVLPFCECFLGSLSKSLRTGE